MLTTEKTVLDVGCGEHVWTRRRTVITRCDNSQAYYNRKEPLEDFDDVDLNGPWPYADDSFDAVIGADVVEHLENVWHFFREATRVAKRTVIISTPNVESKMSRLMFQRTGLLWGFCERERKHSHHITPIFSWQLELAVEQAGWCLADVKEVSYPVPFRRAQRLKIEDVATSKKNARWIVAKAEPCE
jgi:2-polyprenyl-3-methyl-5-hydroxy-6-metoxy-1,4-benzoquinol methylase